VSFILLRNLNDYIPLKKVCQNTGAKKDKCSSPKKAHKSSIKAKKKGGTEDSDEEDTRLQRSNKNTPKSNRKKIPTKRQREEESESDLDYGDSSQEESDEEPKAKKSRKSCQQSPTKQQDNDEGQL
jgi:hypothetical protein